MRPHAPLLALLLACSADHHADRAQQALDAHDLPAAEAAFQRALERDPAHARSLAGLGWTWLLAGSVPAARGSFQRCRELAPAEPDCLRGLAAVELRGGDPGRARRLLEEAQKLAPEDPDVVASLALLDLSTGELEAAERRYSALVAQHPEEGEYRIGLAELRLRQRRTEECLQLVEEALALPLTRRHQALAWLLQARALVAATSGREDRQRCAETMPPILAWLGAAEQAVAAAEATGVELPEGPAVRRMVLRRRSAVEELCPPERPAPTLPPPGEQAPPRE